MKVLLVTIFSAVRELSYTKALALHNLNVQSMFHLHGSLSWSPEGPPRSVAFLHHIKWPAKI